MLYICGILAAVSVTGVIVSVWMYAITTRAVQQYIKLYADTATEKGNDSKSKSKTVEPLTMETAHARAIRKWRHVDDIQRDKQSKRKR